MYVALQPVKATVEILGQYQFLLRIESKKKTRSGNSQFVHEVECIDPTNVAEERDRICKALGLAVVEFSMPEEALKVNLANLEESMEIARAARGSVEIRRAS